MSRQDFERLAGSAGLAVTALHGEYSRGALDAASSPFMIFELAKSSDRRRVSRHHPRGEPVHDLRADETMGAPKCSDTSAAMSPFMIFELAKSSARRGA
jgi:hypothetical protein